MKIKTIAIAILIALSVVVYAKRFSAPKADISVVIPLEYDKLDNTDEYELGKDAYDDWRRDKDF